MRIIKERKIKNIVAFCVLMENGNGILDKSPEYILEKFDRYCLSEEDEWGWGLNSSNRAKLLSWFDKWLYDKPTIK